MRHGTRVFLLVACLPAFAADSPDRILARLAEEAEVLSHMAPQIIGRETLNQRSLKPKLRFRLRIGPDATKPLPQEYQTRQIVSEYGFTAMKDNPGALQEVRQVVSVDGRRVRTPEKARETLILGIQSEDDRRKKKLLVEFEKYGLLGAAVDFGQVLLLFERPRQANYEFKEAGRQLLGAEKVLVLSFRQVAGPDQMTVFRGRQAIRPRLEGDVWIRESDALPLKIVLRNERTEGERTIVSEGSVEYAQSRFAVLLPAAVTYREHMNGTLITESRYTYSEFRRFGAESDIKFEVEPSPPK